MPITFDFQDLVGIAPAVVAVLAGLAVITLDIFLSRSDDREIMPVTSAGAVICVGVLLGVLWATRRDIFAGTLTIDRFGLLGAMTATFAALIAILAAPRYLQRNRMEHGEFYGLMLLSLAGMIFMCMARDLITAFVALETMSIAIYGLVGMNKGDPLGAEAATKYFVVGAIASGFLTFGIALIYAGTGTIEIPQLVPAIMKHWGAGASYLLLPGLAFMIVGFCFKIGAVPFHNWVPDVYQGAPTPVVGFMAVGVKIAAAILFGRIFLSGFRAFYLFEVWMPILAIISVLSMVIGGFSALVQHNVKRMLAFSAISHTGFLLMAFLGDFAQNRQPSALVVYLVAYAASVAGSFAVLSQLSHGKADATDLAHLQGLAVKRPGLAAAMGLFMLSLAGVPATAGFVGKLTVLWEVISGPRLSYPWLEAPASSMYVAIVGIVMSLIALGYYLPVLISMYMREPLTDGETEEPQWSANLAIWICALATLGFGLMPGRLIEVAVEAAKQLLP